jgi:anthranilate/para-aminobenzoate synthase component I/branched-subunit amino acid aminotransferase/4-amino-4-deoxychorismate lyase
MTFDCLVKRVKTSAQAADIFRSLFVNSAHSYWLDSSRVDTGYARFSFMGDDSGPHAHVVSHRVGQSTTVELPSGETITHNTDIFSFLDSTLSDTNVRTQTEVPFDFKGGYVGYLGYELMAVTEQVEGRSSQLPDAQLLFSDRFLAIDHLDNTLYLVALHDGDPSSAQYWIESTFDRLKSVVSRPAPPKAEICQPSLVQNYLLHDKSRYLANIGQCKEKIEAGESYEICLTNRVQVPLRSYDQEEVFETYLILRETNPAPYACFIKNEAFSILCSSPERFLKINRGGEVEARPIKGTMPRDENPERDEVNRISLSEDKRFFSENLMIVDLLRNDLSRSCVPGTISVPALMKVESYATLHQLVSTIRGTLQSSVTRCVAGCFPGGSMTGAPKKRTLEILNDIEGVPRGIYSGAIGYLSLNATADLNIVIRTIVVTPTMAEIGVGGAITYLSDAEQEYDEMILKALAPFSALRRLLEQPTPGDPPSSSASRAVAQMGDADVSAYKGYQLTRCAALQSRPDFQLFETIYATHDQGARHLERHLRRLQSSALCFGFPFNETHLRQMLSAHCAGMQPDTPYRIRAALNPAGEFQVSVAPLMALKSDVVDILLAPDQGFAPQSSKNEYLLHKGTLREEYDRAWRAAEEQGAFDMLFFNERGELTEGGRSNVFVKVDGCWWTPPVSSGLLPGVMRSVVLEDPAWRSAERVLTRKDLERAGAIMVCNALRGPLKARIVNRAFA